MKNIITLVFAIFAATQMYFHAAPASENEAVSDKLKTHSEAPEKKVQEIPFEQSFNEHIEHWIAALAKNQEFSSWENVDWKKSPLGPGTHGWLVLLYNKSQEVGYLVVHSTPEGDFELSEYGIGDNPLFSLTRLNQTLVQHKLIPEQETYERIYVSPFEAVWRLSGEDHTYYFDAVTGEAFPLNERDMSRQYKNDPKSHITNKSPTLSTSLQLPLFDPFEQLNWINNNNPLQIESLTDLTQALVQPSHKITYTVSIFNDNILIPLSVVGYHLWDQGKAYITLDQQGLRFVPFPTLQEQKGEFYTRR